MDSSLAWSRGFLGLGILAWSFETRLEGVGRGGQCLSWGLLLPIYGSAVISHQIDLLLISAALPFAMLAFVNLLGTHWADREADQAVGKNTLTTILSVARLRFIYLLTLLGAYAGIILLPGMPVPVRMGSLTILPLSIWGYYRFTKQHSPAPSVYPMVVYLFIQVITWGFLYFE